MLGMGLKKLAQELNFICNDGVAYGPLMGYMVTLKEGMGNKTVAINVGFSTPVEVDAVTGFLRRDPALQGCRITDVQANWAFLIVNFVDNPGTLDKVRSFLQYFLPILPTMGGLGLNHCCYCGQMLAPNTGSIQMVDGLVAYIHAGCAQSVARDIQTIEGEAAQEPKHYGRGVLGAFLGGIVGAIPWMAVYVFGWFVGWLGFLIGAAVSKGYDLLGGKAGKAKVWIVLGFTLLSVIIAQFLGEYLTIVRELLPGGQLEGAPFNLTFYFMGLALQDSSILMGILGNIALGFVFALMGVWSLLKGLWSQNRTIKTKNLDHNLPR